MGNGLAAPAADAATGMEAAAVVAVAAAAAATVTATAAEATIVVPQNRTHRCPTQHRYATRRYMENKHHPYIVESVRGCEVGGIGNSREFAANLSTTHEADNLASAS